jgi:hypothetical protein
LAIVLAACTMVIAGCVAPPTRHPEIKPPSPELLGAGVFAIPQGCEPESGTVYRTTFTVEPDGRVASAASASGDGCVQRALREWVVTFIYRPIGTAAPVTIDWMEVKASRGG